MLRFDEVNFGKLARRTTSSSILNEYYFDVHHLLGKNLEDKFKLAIFR